LLKRPPLVVRLALALTVSASTWFYVERILKPQQVADAALHNRPRGNLSDLYPRWLGSRELLLHGRNPYSLEITREIQQGYYGRVLDPSRPDDPKDQQGFAYPTYVVFLLSPTVGLPFEAVQIGFRWLLFGLAVVSVLLWLYVVRWELGWILKFILIVLMLGWWPMVQGIKLQQLSLLVAGLLAVSSALLSAGWLFLAGGLLALATIKPQLAWPMVLWLLVWAVSDWRSRRRFVFGFTLMMILLLSGAELVLPGWLGMFVHAIRQYHHYTQNESVLVWTFGSIFGRLAEVVSLLLCALLVWRVRREPASSAEFGRALALVLALTVVVVPMFAPYNQVLLAPAIFILLRSASSSELTLPAIRLARGVGWFSVVWPWIVTAGLSAGYLWLTPELRARFWTLPFYSNFLTPIFIFGLTSLDAWMSDARLNHARILRDGAEAE
jgi:hypothetical protein